MPFKDPQRAIEYRRSETVKKRSREWMRKWRNENREKNNKRQREYQKRRRSENKDNGYEKWKADPIQMGKRRDYARKYWRDNKQSLKEEQNKKTRNLSDYYVRKQLSKEGVSMSQLNQTPIIIEAKRLTLKIKREIYGKLN